MLVLTRRIGESIFIGDNITVLVMNVGEHGVVLGVEAPKDTPVDREEISYRKKREQGVDSDKMNGARPGDFARQWEAQKAREGEKRNKNEERDKNNMKKKQHAATIAAISQEPAINPDEQWFRKLPIVEKYVALILGPNLGDGLEQTMESDGAQTPPNPSIHLK